jgi:hypothetical protein
MSDAQKEARRRYNEKHCLVTWAVQVTTEDKAAIKAIALEKGKSLGLEKGLPIWQAISMIIQERRNEQN